MCELCNFHMHMPIVSFLRPLLFEWLRYQHTHTHLYDHPPLGLPAPEPLIATDNRLYCFTLFSYNTILLIVCGESMFIHGKVSTLLKKKQKKHIQMAKHFSITCINIISLYSLDCSSGAATTAAATDNDAATTHVHRIKYFCWYLKNYLTHKNRFVLRVKHLTISIF